MTLKFQLFGGLNLNNDFRENDFDEDFKINENSFNSLNGSSEVFTVDDSKLVDVRIVLTDLDYIEAISKAVSNFDLSNFNVLISSIIPVDNLRIAKNAIKGADLVLVACESNSNGKSLFDKFKDELKTDYNYVEYLSLPSLDDFDEYSYNNDDNLFEDEIANSIIRSGLYSISNLSSINQAKYNYLKLKEIHEMDNSKMDKVLKENEVLIKETSALRERDEKSKETIKILQKELDKIKSDFSDLKSRFESIHSKNSLEVYSLYDLWMELFNESLTENIYKFILLATDNFRPSNLLIGQGAISAESKEDALDWLKIIKTAFILVDDNINEFDFNNFNSNFNFEKDYFKQSNAINEVSDEFDPISDALGNINAFDESNQSDSESIDDGFIYNERFEGNTPQNEESSSFRGLNFNKDFDLKSDDENIDDADDVDSVDGVVDAVDAVDVDEGINVFNLNSLKDVRRPSKKEDNEDSDYDYDDYDDEEDIEEDIQSPFSNLW